MLLLFHFFVGVAPAQGDVPRSGAGSFLTAQKGTPLRRERNNSPGRNYISEEAKKNLTPKRETTPLKFSSTAIANKQK